MNIFVVREHKANDNNQVKRVVVVRYHMPQNQEKSLEQFMDSDINTLQKGNVGVNKEKNIASEMKSPFQSTPGNDNMNELFSQIEQMVSQVEQAVNTTVANQKTAKAADKSPYASRHESMIQNVQDLIHGPVPTLKNIQM